MHNIKIPPPITLVGKVPVRNSGVRTFSPFTVAAACDFSHHAILKSTGLEVDFLNLVNTFKGKTVY